MEFEPFVKEHQDMVFSTCLRLLGSFADAEDIAQNVFLKAYQGFADLKNHPAPAAWLRTLAKNMSINHITRHKKRWVLFSALENGGESFPDPQKEDTTWLYGQHDGLKKALLKLPERYRIPLVLFHYEETSYGEISTMLKVSVAKVKTDIHRGRKRLKQLIEKMEPKNE